MPGRQPADQTWLFPGATAAHLGVGSADPTPRDDDRGSPIFRESTSEGFPPRPLCQAVHKNALSGIGVFFYTSRECSEYDGEYGEYNKYGELNHG